MNGLNFKMLATTFVTFTLGNTCYAIDALSVREIKDYQNVVINTIQGAEYVVGLSYFNQKMTPIIDLEMRLGKSSSINHLVNSILFVQLEQEYLGLIVEELPNIIELSEDKILLEKSSLTSSRFIVATFKYENKTCHILDLKKLLENSIESYAESSNNTPSRAPNE